MDHQPFKLAVYRQVAPFGKPGLAGGSQHHELHLIFLTERFYRLQQPRGNTLFAEFGQYAQVGHPKNPDGRPVGVHDTVLGSKVPQQRSLLRIPKQPEIRKLAQIGFPGRVLRKAGSQQFGDRLLNLWLQQVFFHAHQAH
ncbi:MAG: hypothetical protein IPN74_02705 [Haliscomenobacter sp.]|nr:hypothetical protein [Haliscomenobacter sp.]